MIRRISISFSLVGLALVCLIAALIVGPASISMSDAVAGLLGQADSATTAIMREVRLPRAIGALIVGAGLGASGAALQGFTRNDLAAPGLLGFSACAALGAVAALYFGLNRFILPAAIIGALIGAGVISVMARRQVARRG